MPFIPHTEADVREMLDAIGAPQHRRSVRGDPAALRQGAGLQGVPAGVDRDGSRRASCRRFATRDGRPLNFLGAGAYEHHIPAAVWAIVTRGEFYSAYTPYQAEASQGTLQLLYEYQTMMASLTGMQVSNASLYDGASALAEACLMAVRAHRKSKSARILVPAALNPTYRRVARSTEGAEPHVRGAAVRHDGRARCRWRACDAYEGQDITAVVIQQPNFFGVLEDVDAIADWAHAQRRTGDRRRESDCRSRC